MVIATSGRFGWGVAGAFAFAFGLGCTSSAAPGSSAGGGDAGGGSPGGSSSADGGGVGTGGALPPGTLLYVRTEAKDHDVLVAHDLATGDERTVTDLTGDGSSGWTLDSYAVSPDRRRIALASLYGPTEEDVATGLATRAIWSLAVDGTDFRRLTPTFPNRSGGRSSYQLSVGDPMWTQDGSRVIFGFGEYWTNGTRLEGGSFPWSVSARGDDPPSPVETPTSCTVLHPSRNPATGDMLYQHSVCIPGQGESGLYLYPEQGTTTPQRLPGLTDVDVYLATPSWLADGSGFLFLGSAARTNEPARIFAYDLGAGAATALLTAPAGSYLRGVAVAPDGTKIVYCLETGDRRDLHVVDATVSPATDVPLTSDGVSCQPSF